VLHFAVDDAFDTLLRAWRIHHEVTTAPVSDVRRRAQVRIELDRARERMHRLRVAVYPEGDELDAIARSMYCEALEVVVHLRWLDRDDRFPGRLRCPCGETVPIDVAE